jgi:peptidoglycan lytic transglycosylase G
MKLKIKDILNRNESYLILSFFIAVLFVFFYTFFTPNYYHSNSPIEFDINEGETFSSIVDRLYEKNIIPSKSNFRIAAFIYGAEKNVRAARYYIPNGLSYLDLLDLFMSGKCYFARKVRVSDGQTIKWLASRLKWKVYVDSTKFVSLTEDTIFICSLGLKVNSLEGYLFPGEYKIYEFSKPDEVLKIFYNGFKEFYVDSLKQRADKLGLTTHEVLTLASIVKGETNKVEEMSRIAGVYLNRLRIGMRLQADPTVQYLLPGGWRRLLYEDLEIDSPYNTYKYAGLPPGPINNPGKNPILAVLYPEEHRYLYFVADGNGGHNFSETLSGHSRNVREYRKWIRSQRN